MTSETAKILMAKILDQVSQAERYARHVIEYDQEITRIQQQLVNQQGFRDHAAKRASECREEVEQLMVKLRDELNRVPASEVDTSVPATGVFNPKDLESRET